MLIFLEKIKRATKDLVLHLLVFYIQRIHLCLLAHYILLVYQPVLLTPAF
jgi:hypothetical protein